MDTNRLEAFSDGVFAIATTLLVLDLRVPDTGRGSLASALGHQWPSYAAYIVSFLVIGIIWVNHHGMFSQVARTDRTLLFLNLVLLLVVAAIPFPTALLSRYLRAGDDAHVAAAVYSGVMVAMSIAFSTMWLWVTGHPTLLAEGVDPVAARARLRRFSAGLVVYLAMVGVAFINAPLTLAVHGVIALFYVADQLNPGAR